VPDRHLIARSTSRSTERLERSTAPVAGARIVRIGDRPQQHVQQRVVKLPEVRVQEPAGGDVVARVQVLHLVHLEGAVP
jgi:hypothetical protein